LMVGTMATYFFTKDQVAAKDSQIAAAQSAFIASEKEKIQAANQIQRAAEAIKPFAASHQAAEAVSTLETVGRNLKYVPAATTSATGWREKELEVQPTASASP
jgi:hypothetical protein